MNFPINHFILCPHHDLILLNQEFVFMNDCSLLLLGLVLNSILGRFDLKH
jgi:hypothetical protein